MSTGGQALAGRPVQQQERAAKRLAADGVCQECVVRIVGFSSEVDKQQQQLSIEKQGATPDVLGIRAGVSEVSNTTEIASSSAPVCILCLGLLQRDRQAPGKGGEGQVDANGSGKDNAEVWPLVRDILDRILELGFDFNSFGLDVTLPSNIAIREHALRSFLDSNDWLTQQEPEGAKQGQGAVLGEAAEVAAAEAAEVTAAEAAAAATAVVPETEESSLSAPTTSDRAASIISSCGDLDNNNDDGTDGNSNGIDCNSSKNGTNGNILGGFLPLKEEMKRQLVPLLERELHASFDAACDSFRLELLFTHSAAAADCEVLRPLMLSAGLAMHSSHSRHQHKRGRYSRGGRGWRAGRGSWEASREEEGEEREARGSGSGGVQVDGERGREGEAESRRRIGQVLERVTRDQFLAACPWPPSKVTSRCSVSVACSRRPMYLAGRYLKLRRNISQSPWLVNEEQMGEGSVQDFIASHVLKYITCEDFKFQAAGREDIDVRMLGSGRPFLLEMINVKKLPGQSLVKEIEEEINREETGKVAVRQLQVASREAALLLREGEAEKEKSYRALVWLSRPLQDGDVQLLESKNNLVIEQKTPIRVLHRRSPLTRPRSILRMTCERIPDHPSHFFLHLTTQAGTYVKEFVHGDFGRTSPSVGTLLGCVAHILMLDVLDVKMDFL